MSEEEQQHDSDLDDYDIEANETANYTIIWNNEGEGSLSEFYDKRAIHTNYLGDGSMKERPWTYEGVDKKEFFNFGVNEQQWKMLVNKHILMLYEKHVILRTNPNIQAAQNLVLKQIERGMQNPGIYPGFQMMMQYPQYYEQEEGYQQEYESQNSDE